jgi:hypothetical protein
MKKNTNLLFPFLLEESPLFRGDGLINIRTSLIVISVERERDKKQERKNLL